MTLDVASTYIKQWVAQSKPFAYVHYTCEIVVRTLCQSNDFKIGIIMIEQDWSVQCQGNVTEWDAGAGGLVSQWGGTIKLPMSAHCQKSLLVLILP